VVRVLERLHQHVCSRQEILGKAQRTDGHGVSSLAE
jgi:hypothetical protein